MKTIPSISQSSTSRILPILFFSSIGLSIVIAFLSIGWYLILLGVVFAVLGVFHLIAGLQALKARPQINILLILTCLYTIFLALIRPDGDDKGTYTGFSVLSYYLHLIPDPYMELHFWGSLFFCALPILLILDIILLIRSNKIMAHKL